MNWLRRIFTLPKAHNSLSDVLGADAAHTVAETIHGLLAATVATALHSVIASGETGLEKIAGLVFGAVNGTLQSVSPTLAASIEKAVVDGVKSAESVIETDAAVVADAVVKKISAVLKLS